MSLSEDTTFTNVDQQRDIKDNFMVKPIANINYSDEYKELMECFWKIYEKEEKSQEAFDLTTKIIGLCEGHYTVWQYRRKLVKALKMNLLDELSFVKQYTVERPKNYQLWRHREGLINMILCEEGVGDGLLGSELEDLDLVLYDEPKNYHAWQYRQWMIKKFPILHSKELPFVEKIISEDVYNNSAWNYRYFLLFGAPEFEEKIDWRREEEFLLGCFGCVGSDNYSIFHFLNAIFGKCPLEFKSRMVEGLRESFNVIFKTFNFIYPIS